MIESKIYFDRIQENFDRISEYFNRILKTLKESLITLIETKCSVMRKTDILVIEMYFLFTEGSEFWGTIYLDKKHCMEEGGKIGEGEGV